MSKNESEHIALKSNLPEQAMASLTATAGQIPEFDAVIDVRSPAEFAQDHILGAINCPVLTNEQRVEVGTLHKHNPFEARKLGAAYITENMSRFLRTTLAEYKNNWRPLVYCWRGGMRSGSVVHILQQVGWAAHQLSGGYKAYRHHILDQLEQLPQTLRFTVVCGPTGSGKSRFLAVLAEKGYQVLDLEALAQHRGSLLGTLPGREQPSQRFFETCLVRELSRFSPERPVYIEAESKRIGQLTLPAALFEKMHQGDCLQLVVPLDERIRYLCEDYRFYIENPPLLKDKISRLTPYHAKTLIQEWHACIEEGNFAQLVRGLLEQHYDPLYWRSMHAQYPRLDESPTLELSSLDTDYLKDSLNTLNILD